MVITILLLQLCVLLIELIPKRFRFITPILALSAINMNISLHRWPFGIEYNAFGWSWSGAVQILASCLVGLIILKKPDRSRGWLAILIGIIQVLRSMDWFNIYVGFEILLIGTMLAMPDWQVKQKYLYQQIFASILMLLGIGMTFVDQGHFGVRGATPIVLFAGLALKSGLLPQQIFLYKGSAKYFPFLISKASLYCLSLFTTQPLYTALYLVGIIYSCFWCDSEFESAIILNSNAMTLLLFKNTSIVTQIIYLLYSFYIQQSFGKLWLLFNYLPLSIDFIIKIMIAIQINRLDAFVVLMSGVFFSIKATKLFIKRATIVLEDTDRGT